MSLVADLAAVLSRHGAPSTLAVEIAIEVSAKSLPKIERELRNRQIRDLFNGRNASELCERFGLGRSWLYVIAKQSTKPAVALDKAEVT